MNDHPETPGAGPGATLNLLSGNLPAGETPVVPGQGGLVDETGMAHGAGIGAAGGGPVIESNTDNFMHDVIEASMQVPVIVDFWAPWCGPCKTLGPLLEKLVRRQGGLVKMVKIDVDQNQALAQQLQIQSVPTVFAFKDGRPVNAFQGALPESQLQAFIDKLLEGAKSPIDSALEQADQLLGAGDASAALQVYLQVVAHDPTITRAVGGMIRAMAQSGDIAGARDTINSLDAKTLASNDVQSAISVLELAEQGANDTGVDVGALEKKIAKNPKDMNSRLELAMHHYAGNNVDGAIEQLLEMISLNRKWNDEAARKQLVKIFDALGPTDPRTIAARQKLSILLFS